MLKTVFSEDVRPSGILRCGRAGDDPEAFGLLDDGHLFCFSGGDLPSATEETDLSGFLDHACVVDCEVEIEQLGLRRGSPTGAALADAFFNRLARGHAGAAGAVVVVMPIDLGDQQLVGLNVVAHRFDTHQRGEPLLPEAELALDLALGLGISGDKVADSQAAQGALKLGEGVGVAGLARFVTEEAEAVGVEVVGQAVGGEDLPDMGEVGEGRFRLDEACSDDETGGVVNGQSEYLERFAGPPLVRRAVVLEEIAVTLALPSAAGFGASFERFTQQFGHSPADMFADIGGGAFETEAAEEFVGEETEVGGFARGESGAQEAIRLIRPGGGVIAT